MGRPFEKTDYDKRDWASGKTDPLGHYSSTVLDASGSELGFVDPLGSRTTQQYNDFGELVSSANENGETTTYAYNFRGERYEQRDPLGNLTTWSFDQNGNTSLIKLPGDRRYGFTYDPNNQLIETRTPLGHRYENAYDDLGRLIGTTEPSGDRITFELDLTGAKTAKIVLPDGGSETRINYRRDLNGNRINVHDEDRGKHIGRSFDTWNRLTTYINDHGEELRFEYDANDNLTRLIYPGGDAVTYTYDSNDQMKTVTDWAGRRTEYVYDLNGRLVVTHLPNGTQRRNAFDAAGRLLGRHEINAAGETIFYSLFRPDPAGQILEEVQFPPATADPAAMAFTATYDADSRLATYNNQAVLYDADGNLLSAAFRIREPLEIANGIIAVLKGVRGFAGGGGWEDGLQQAPVLVIFEGAAVAPRIGFGHLIATGRVRLPDGPSLTRGQFSASNGAGIAEGIKKAVLSLVALAILLDQLSRGAVVLKRGDQVAFPVPRFFQLEVVVVLVGDGVTTGIRRFDQLVAVIEDVLRRIHDRKD